ncbi:baseplate J-like protein [Caudoviricetes sp.]|nr:baseplate J-like protein [Caudoviricetes sp.]
MAKEQVGIVTVPSGSAAIREQWLQDLRLAALDAGLDEPPIEPGTDFYLEAEANAQLALIGLANIAISARDASVLDATGDALDAIRKGDGLPEVPPAGSSGKIRINVAGPTTIPNATQGKLANGLRFKTVGVVVNPADGQEIDVAAIDTGAATNAKGGSAVQFVSPPTNVSRAAVVSSDFPLTGGADVETDARKRDRVLNTRRNKPAGGNWAYWRQFVQDNYAAIQDTYVYCAPGGPSSQLIVPTKAFDRTNNNYSRAPSDALMQTIRSAVQAKAGSFAETVVRGPADQAADFTLKVEIPQSTLSGGNGQGWTNSDPWPQLEVSDGGRVAIAVGGVGTDNDLLTIDADTSTSPIAGQTEIAWWSSVDRKFYTALVVDVDGASVAGNWIVTLDRPLVGIDGVGPADGDYICPNAQNLSAYGDTWVTFLESLGPGEVTNDPDRIPRALRNPSAADEDPYSVNGATLTRVSSKHPEITNIAFGYAPVTAPTIPATVADPPNVLTPRRFAVYPL